MALLLLGYLSIAVSTGDLLWFWPAFGARPMSIGIYCQGQLRSVRPGTEAFDQLTAQLSDGLWGLKRWTSLSMSESTWNEYVEGNESQVLEFRFNPPAKIHSYYRFFKNFDALIVPLKGRHANANPVFGLKGDRILAGALHLESNAPLMSVVHDQSLCP